MFLTSFDVALEDYRKLLGEVRDNNLQIENANFDVGEVTTAGQYTLEDYAYATIWLPTILSKLPRHFAPISAAFMET